jgi:co-chaperonin GroES (HSP10)
MKNESGIHPCLDRVLIKPDDIEKVTEGGIIIPENVGELHAMAQSIGTFVEAGPDAYTHYTEVNEHSDKPGMTVMTRGYKGPAAVPGQRVAFARYGGLQVTGKDGKTYRLMNDVDVTATVEEGVSFTDLKARKPIHESNKRS